MVISSQLFAQNSRVLWSVLDMGFAIPVAPNTRLLSAIGQSFVCPARNQNSWVESGFLVDTLFRGPVTGIGTGSSSVPATYELRQNYPNPFNPTTRIEFSIQISGFTSVKVYDILGREVRVIVQEHLPAGRHGVTFDASGLASGVYVYRIQSRTFADVKRMILLK